MEYDQVGKLLKDLVMAPGSQDFKSYEGGIHDREFRGD